ncbi:two-component system sensor histidine kinase KdpD [Kribbella sp. VKM Ac-2527]|uniref:histidine kinase n=2 Tax=Kribbella caucasensis TaxID=2512215 RepID=A0A4V3CB46_9ACTN|nr:two-component system sensor histidine kinase KdpD [Kribbella sp. VKM Ac-2527]
MAGSARPRGHLRIYLGAAPGVGKTYKMLGEAQRRHERGTDVVVGFVETHGRSHTAEMLEGLEVVPRKILDHRGASFTEMDLDAILTRRPQVVLVDELAHTNVPGSRNNKRWEDIDDLLSAGIDVISTVNIQHLESINDVVEKITGVPQRETVPDRVVRAADQIELVDMTPEALRRRMAHGNVYTADKVDAALGNYFRVGNLSALRELALLWLADRVDAGLQQYREQHDIDSTWEARERVVVALTGGPEGETLIRRAARIAARSSGGDLLAVHVTRSDGLTGVDPARLAQQRRLIESIGGTYHQVVGDDIPAALLSFARAENATQLVIGASRRTWLGSLLTGPGIGFTSIQESGDIDVHIVTHSEVGRGRLPRLTGGNLSKRRLIYGFALAVLLPPLLALLLGLGGDTLNLTSNVLAFLLAVVVVALVGGLWPAILMAIAGTLVLNYFFTPPVGTFTIAELNNALALGIFVAVAALVSSVVDRAARRTRQAARAAAESETLATLSGTVLRGETALPALLERVREAFGMTGACLMERIDDDEMSETWRPLAGAGTPTCRRPEDGDAEIPGREDLVLVLQGRQLAADERRLVGAFAAHAAALVDRTRLSEAAAEAKPLAEADKLRTALLRAVGHDLRSPLASAKASVTSLRSSDVDWTPAEREELLETADESLDRLSRLVDNLLDLSRLQAGVLPVFTRPTALDEIMPGVLAELGESARQLTVEVSEDLPLVDVDPALLERVVANLLANAIRHSPPGQAPLLTGSSLGDVVEIRVIDRGPGIPREDRDRVFAPFQRLGDTDNTTGVGLGLALARGLAEAMHGTLQPEDTPGGGLTMVVSMPAATTRQAEAPVPGRLERGTLEQLRLEQSQAEQSRLEGDR